MSEDRAYYTVADWNRALTIVPAWGATLTVTIDDVLNYELDVFDAAHPETDSERACLVPPLPATFAAVLNRGTRRDGQP